MTIVTFRRFFEPTLRRVLHFYWRFARGMTLGVRGIVLNARDEVFLIEHSYVSGWHLPGGGVETGETFLESLGRELAEEGNIRMTAPPVLHGLFYNPSVSRRDHVAVYVVRGFVQERPPERGHEIIAHGFFPRSALPAETTPGTLRRLAEVFDGAPVTERW